MIFTRFDKTLRLLHEDILIKDIFEEVGEHVKSVYLPIQMYNYDD